MVSALQATLSQRLPMLLGALAIFALGWVVALIVRAAVRKGLHALRLNARVGSSTQRTIDLEGGIALVVFWLVIVVALIGALNVLDLTVLSEPFRALLSEVLVYLPRLVSGGLLLLLGWVLATLARAGAKRLLALTNVDEKLSAAAGMEPVSHSIGNVVYWLVLLLFLPIVLGTLDLDGLLVPVQTMLTGLLAHLPNVFAAAVIGGVGWLIGRVLRGVVTNLLAASGADRLGTNVGIGEAVKLSQLGGTLVFFLVFVPALIAALDALKIESISRPATDMLSMIMAAVPNVLAAVLILTISWYVARFVTGLLAKLLAAGGFDTLPERLSVAGAFRGTAPSLLVARIALFFAMLFATVEAANRLGFTQVRDVVTTFIRFGGDVLLGSVILVIGFWLSNLAYEAISRASGKSTGFAPIARVAIIGLVIAMGLRAMGIADDIVNLAFGLTLGAVAVAIALSFGLGGREAAGKLADHWLTKVRGDKP